MIGYRIFSSIFFSNEIIIEYGITPFNIVTEQPVLWHYIKILFIISYIFSSLIISNSFFSIIKNFKCKSAKSKKHSHKTHIKKENYPFLTPNNNSLSLLVGKSELTDNNIYLSEKSLYQNILITGTIGSGKTSSAIYPFTKQLIAYMHNNEAKKLGMLILDVKGNYSSKVLEFAKLYNRENDVIVIELNGKYKYNPLDKPNLKASVLANRLKTILLLFSKNNSESFWLDKAEEVLKESIKICRLYNNNYVTFEELHKLISQPNYYKEKIELLRQKFIASQFNEAQVYDLLTAITFFEKEFLLLDSRTLSILKSEITRITNCFISEYEILNTFSPPISDINFKGFEDVINKGKIVVLNMNISEYRNLSKIIAAYLKLDFQSEVLMRLAKSENNNFRSVCFISDEYHEYCVDTDADFFAQSREAKCINIVATQSYTSLLNTLNSQSTVKVITQNLINKLWFRTDDIFTIEDAQKQIGKEDKEKISKGITENAKETIYSYFTNSLNSKDSNISETISTYIHSDFIYDTNFFTQELQTFTCLGFLSDGNKILKPQKIKLFPYFKKG